MADLAQELKREVCTLIGALCVDKMELQIALAQARAEIKLASESRPHSEDSAADPAPPAEA